MLDKLQKLSELLGSPEGRVDAVLLISELKEEVGVIGETLGNLEYKNFKMHFELGHKMICDKHNTKIMYSDGVGAICQKCEDERIKENNIDVKNADNYYPLECPAWSWRDEKRFVLLDDYHNMWMQTSTRMKVFYSIKQAKEALKEVNSYTDDSPKGELKIVELKGV